MAIIKQVEWTSPESQTAILVLEADGMLFVVFSLGSRIPQVGESVSGPLSPLDIVGMMRSDARTPSVRRIGDGFAQSIVGLVTTREMVACGSVLIEIDFFLPGDCVPGDWVQFTCSRLDYVAES